MARTGFWWRLLMALVLTGVLVAIGVGVFQAGYSQGYLTGGAAAAGRAETEGAPAALFPGGGYPYYGWGFRPFFFPFFGPWMCFIGIALFFLFGGFFRFWGWRGGYHHHHHHGPPWERQDEQAEQGGETQGNAGM